MNRAAKKQLEFEFKVVTVKDASGDCIIEGYANTNSKDRVGDVVLPSAFEKSLAVYQKNPVVLLNHDWNNVIGRCIHQEITDKGLFIKARISDTRNDIKTLIREGCYSTFSIGYNELDADYDESTKTKYIKELELLEISVVSVPANTEAMFTQVEQKTDTEDADKKGDEEKKAKKAGTLKAFISDIKTIVGKGFDDEALFAVIDYFNSQEETMTKNELIKLLQAKTLPEVEAKPEEAKQDQAKPEDKPQEDPMKAIAAKLDALAQAMVQLMDKLDQMEQEESDEAASEDKPSPEDQAKPEDGKPADEGKGEDMKPAKEEEPKKEEDKKDEGKDEEEKELDLTQVDKDIAEITAQIETLDEEING